MAKIIFQDLILWEDEDYIVINKPPFISTLEDRKDKINVLALARNYHEKAQVCHRLDKETTGALVIAKNPEAYRHLSIQFENRTVKKIYHALCDGVHDFKDMVIDKPISKQSGGTVRIDLNGGKEAKTTFNTLKAYLRHTLVECMPATGRMHQIRIHLAVLRAPITGDVQYGGKEVYLSSFKRNYNLKKGTEERPLIKRFALHAEKIGFNLLNGSPREIVAPYSKDFAVVVKQLDKYA